MHPVKILIRPRKCAVWSESSLRAREGTYPKLRLLTLQLNLFISNDSPGDNACICISVINGILMGNAVRCRFISCLWNKRIFGSNELRYIPVRMSCVKQKGIAFRILSHIIVLRMQMFRSEWIQSKHDLSLSERTLHIKYTANVAKVGMEAHELCDMHICRRLLNDAIRTGDKMNWSSFSCPLSSVLKDNYVTPDYFPAHEAPSI